MASAETKNRLFDRYRKGAVLLKKDRHMVLNQESIGLMWTGFKVVAGEPIITAGFTSLGFSIFRRTKFLSRKDFWGRVWQYLYYLRNEAY
ncbi:hypothetical protein KJ665_01695 [Patescibacteria group bacterium]|nr:hypothetical protein [Patescibacteria group bacterium]